jgi:hypothetical protein
VEQVIPGTLNLVLIMVAQTANYFLEDMPSNLRNTSRTFVLEVIDPTRAKSSIDTRLISGNNHLKAIKDPQMSLWSLHMEKGTIPEAFKSSFTSFNAAKNFVEQYYIKRGVKVTEILD